MGLYREIWYSGPMPVDPDVLNFIKECQAVSLREWLNMEPQDRPPMGATAISTYLNNNEYPTPSGIGEWHPGTVWNIMYPNRKPALDEHLLSFLSDEPKTTKQLMKETGYHEGKLRTGLSDLIFHQRAEVIIAPRKGRIGTLPHTYSRVDKDGSRR